MNENETSAERDRRIRGEEARLVHVEEAIIAFKTTTEALRELLSEERKMRGKTDEEMGRHMHDDETRFSSVDSRLQGLQTQMTSVADSTRRIEQSLAGDDGIEKRLRRVEAVQGNFVAGWKALAAAAGLGASLATIAAVLVGLL